MIECMDQGFASVNALTVKGALQSLSLRHTIKSITGTPG